MNRLTLSNRALLHLYRYRHISPSIEVGAPKEITQDGVAEVLGVSRSHAALLVNRLEQDRKLYSGKSRVIGQLQGGARKVYFITPAGIHECETIMRIIEESDENGGGEGLPNNLNYCASSVFWNLPFEDRTLIGCLMVLRTPVCRDDLESFPSIVPFSYKGALSIKPETKRWYIQRADTESLRQWHSAAADWLSLIHISEPTRP